MEPERRTRLRLAAQNAAVSALVHAESAEAGAREVLRAVCENLGWVAGLFWAPRSGDGVLSVRAAWSRADRDLDSFLSASHDITFPPGQGLPGRVVASGEAVWIRDVTSAPDFPRAEVAGAAGLRGAFGVLVPSSGGRSGVLEFFTNRASEPDPELLETMAAVGVYLGQFLQRRRAEAELRATEEQFRVFGSTVPDATFIIDEASRIVYVNDAVRRIFGYSPSELLGAPLTRLIPERYRAGHEAGMRRFMETGERRVSWEGVQYEGLRRDGTEVPLEITYGTFEREGRRYFTGIARDVTERRRAEERLRFQARLLDAVGEAIMATDLEGRLIYWNAAAEKLYGWSSEEVLGRPVEEVTPSDRSRDRAREIMSVLKAGRTWIGEFEVQDRAGRRFPVLVSDSPILDDDGRIIGIIGTSTEITDRKREEEGQRFMAEASRVLASSLDYPTTLRSVATLAVPHLGDWCLVHVRETTDSPVAPVARVVPRGDVDAADRLEGILTGENGPLATVLAEGVTIRAPGSDSPELTAACLAELGIGAVLIVPVGARGAVLGVMTFVTTGSDRRYDELGATLAEELGRRAGVAIDNARLYRDAEEGNRAKADFLAVVSHELRTPLNAIAGYADLLAGGIAGELNEQQQRHIERIKVGAGHLAHLIDEVLAFARVETGRESLVLKDTDLAKVARKAAQEMEPDAEDKGLDLQLDVPAQGPVIRTDSEKVRQILINLVSNAVKYTEQGTVRISLRATDRGAEFQIQDTGIGIEGHLKDRIFDPFWQVESPNTRTMGGTGLGLSVGRKLAALLDGTLEVESQVGVGSTFTLSLPHIPLSPT